MVQPTGSSFLSTGGLKWLCGLGFNEGGPSGQVEVPFCASLLWVLTKDAVIHQ